MPVSAKTMSSRQFQIGIALGSLALASILWGAAILVMRAEQDRAVSAAIRQNQNRAAAFEQYVTRTFEAADLAAVHLADRFGRDRLPPAPGLPPRQLSDPVAANPLFAGVLITDERGDVRWTSYPAAPAENVAGRVIFRRARDNYTSGKLFISRPRYSPLAKATLVAMTRAIRRPNGSFGGTVVIQIRGERLVEFNKGAATRLLDLISVIRLDGFSIARREGQKASFGEDLRGMLVMRKQAHDPNGTYLGPSSIDGIRRYFSHRRIEPYGVFVTVGVGESDILGEQRRRSLFVYIGLALLTLAIGAFAASTIIGIRRRDRAALELAAANRRLREAQRIARLGNWAYDRRNNTLRWSDELCRMYGRAPDDGLLSPEEGYAYFDDPNQQVLRSTITEALASGQQQECDVFARMPGGRETCRRIRMTAWRNRDGTIIGLVGTEQDVTDEKAHEVLRDEVSHVARIEAMNAMAITLAHELAQPLTAASNYMASVNALIRRGTSCDEKLVREGLDQASRQIDLTKNIVRRAREMIAKRRQGKSIAYLPVTVEDAFELVRVANDYPTLEMRQDLAGDARYVAADKVQLQQVFMNMLRNAAEAMRNVEAPQVLVSSQRKGKDTIIICVADNGPGMSPELGDIFSPFASSKASGLGLGLSISRAIVHSFGGRIWVDRGRNGGVICFSLPAAADPPPEG